MPEKKSFRFAVRYVLEDRTKKDAVIHLSMTQKEFENYALRKDRVHAAIDALGIHHKRAVWHEDPDIDSEFEDRVLEAVGAKPGCVGVACYADSTHHMHYMTVVVDGVLVRWMPHQGGDFIKWVLDLPDRFSRAA